MSTRDGEDFASEVHAHIDLETDRLIAEGLDPVEARRAAMRAFGNVALAKERFQESSRWTTTEQLAQDVRYGFRTLIHSPAYTATVVLTLAIGLALTTGLFTVFNAYVLRPFGVRDPGGLYQVVWHARGAGGRSVRWRDYEAIRARQDLFTHALAESTRYVSHEGRPLAAELVSASYFDALGPRMVLGRTLGTVDERANAVVLGYQAWAALFARDEGVVGREIDLNGRPFVVVGVLGPDFAGLHAMPRDIWIPFVAYAETAAPDLLSDRAWPVYVSVRLRPGVTPQQAATAIGGVLVEAVGPDRQARAEIRPQERAVPFSIRLLALLSPVFAAFALVLLAACANVSSVMLARAVARQRDIAVRLSLGASRGRIVRQLLTEGLLLALFAALASLALTFAGLRAATAVFFETLPPTLAAILRTAPLALDYRVFLFALAAGAASTLAFGLLPALQASRVALTSAMGGHTGSAFGSTRLRGVLVAGQVAASLLLVVPALTLARGGAAMRAVDVGFDFEGVLSLNVREGDEVELVHRLGPVLGSETRVASFAATDANPFFGPTRTVVLEASGVRVPTPFNFVSPEYFATLRIPIARGRGFDEADAATGAPVAIVSAATARAFWPGRDPIGQRVRVVSATGDLAGFTDVTVVGTASDVISGLVIDGPEPGHLYLPTTLGRPHARSLLVRARTADGLTPVAVHEILRRAVPDPEVFEAVSLSDVRALQVYPFVAASWVGSLLGAVALALSVTGLFGALSYTLAQRSKEIGIRIALGATISNVVGLVLRQTAWLTGVGALVGVAGAFVVLKVMDSIVRLHAVALLDAVAFAAGLGLVVCAAFVAAFHPARRAARLDPAQTLRAES